MTGQPVRQPLSFYPSGRHNYDSYSYVFRFFQAKVGFIHIWHFTWAAIASFRTSKPNMGRLAEIPASLVHFKPLLLHMHQGYIDSL